MPRLMKLIDEAHEILRCAVAAGRREVSGGLIAPRTVKRMLHHRQQLDMREAHLATRSRRAGRRVRGSSAIVLRPVAMTRDAPRRSHTGESNQLRRRRSRHPVIVVPIVVEVPND